MKDIELKIAEILGRVALDNDMKIPDDIQRLARATRYLLFRLRKMLKVWICRRIL